MRSDDSSRARSHRDSLEPGLVSRWQNELFHAQLLSQCLPVFNLGCFVHTRELLKGKTQPRLQKGGKIWISSNPHFPWTKPLPQTQHCRCWVAQGEIPKELMGRGSPGLLPLPLVGMEPQFPACHLHTAPLQTLPGFAEVFPQ